MSTKKFVARHGLDANFNTISNVADPVNSGDVATKNVTDTIQSKTDSAFEAANTGISLAQSAFNSANNVAPQIEPAFNQANAAFAAANTGIDIAQGAFAAANNVAPQIEPAFNQANAAFAAANTKFSYSGGTISGDVGITGSLVVEGNFTVSGNVTTVSANNLVLQDNMIYLNDDAQAVLNPDLGIAGAYNDGTYHHTGFFRDASDGVWKLFDNYEPEPDASPYIDTTHATFRIANFQANTITGSLFSGSGASLTSIPNSSLVNSSLTVNGTAISLGGSGTVTAAAGTLTGSTLASGVTGSSLTSVGTITSGTWSGSFGAVSGANLTGLTAGNLSGTIPSAVLGNSTHYVGTTAIALNRGSASQTLTGVSIDGNAATATSADHIDGIAFKNSNSTSSFVVDSQATNGIGYSTGYTLFGQTDGGVYCSTYDASWQHQINGDFRTGQIAIRGKNNGTWQAWRTVLDSSNYNSYSPTLTGNGASGTWGISISGNADTVDSLHASSFLRKDITDTMFSGQTSALAFENQSTFFRFAFNKLAFYEWDVGGDMMTIDGGYVLASNSFRSPIFYDSNDTGYYIDPNSSSRVSNLYSTAWFRSYGTQGLYNQDYGVHFYGQDSEGYCVTGSGGIVKLSFRSNHQSTVRGYVYGDTSNDFGFLNNGGSWRLRIVGGDYSLADGSSMRAQLYYDSNDTGYYVNPNDVSQFWRVNASNYVYSSNQSYSTIHYDTNDSGYYIDPNSTSNLNYAVVRGLRFTGVGGDSGNGSVYDSYAIYQQGGSWTHPYPDLCIGYHTGIKIGAYYGYNGTRFYNNSDWATQIFSVGDGDNNVRVLSDIRSPIFYDYNDTGYYLDANSTSRFVRINQNANEWNYSHEGWQRLYYQHGNGTIYKGGSTSQWTHIFRNHDDGTRWLMAHGGDFYASGNITAYWSDRRLKKNIEKISDWKNILDNINGYRFQWNDIGKKVMGNESDDIEVGLIAQEVNDVFPQAAAIQMLQYKDNVNGTLIPKDDINYDPENPYLTVREEKLIPVLVEALKSHEEEIEKLKLKIQKLENIVQYI